MLCAYSNVHIFIKKTITITGYEDDDTTKWVDKRNKGAIFKDCAIFKKWINNKKTTDR